jgi:hypothetical protein
MWDFKVNLIRNEEGGVKNTNFSKKILVQGGHNSGNSLARVFNLLKNVE